jgi:hypothetical protein
LAFQTPWGIAADREDNVFVTDKDRAMVCKITPTGGMTNLAGLPGNPRTRNGPGAYARLVQPRGIALDQTGNVCIAYANRLRRITPFGDASLFPQWGRGPGGEIAFDLPSGVAVDRQGNVFVAERYTIQKITPAGELTTLAGKKGQAGHEDGPGPDARFSDMEKGIALDAAGNLYVGDTLNNTIRKLTPVGTNWVVTTLAGRARVFGSADGTSSAARFSHPCGLAVGSGTILYVADSGNHTIRKVAPAGTNWVVRTFAGLAGNSGFRNGTGTNALFNTPLGVALDSADNVYVADTGNHLVRRITMAGQVVSVGGPAKPLAGGPGAPAPPPDVAATLPETARDCVRLARAGMGEEVILAFVRRDHNAPYTLTEDQITCLEDQGVPEKVILVLAK